MRKNKETIADHGPGADLAVASNEKSRKTRAGFAALAVLGLGAGITLAAFTGNVLFEGDVAVAGEGVFQLKGAVTDAQEVIPGEWDVGSIGIGDIDLSPSVHGHGAVTKYLWVQDGSSAGAVISQPTDVLVVTPPATQGVTVKVGEWVEVPTANNSWRAPLTVEASTDAAGWTGSFAIDVTGTGDGTGTGA